MSDTRNFGKACTNISILTRNHRPSVRAWTAVWAHLLRLELKETRVATRGFNVDSPELVARIEGIGTTFAHGFNGAMRSLDLKEVMLVLQSVPVEDSGFAFEGAAMGLAVADFFQPRRRLFEGFITGPARHHEYMAWVGLGWSFARLPVSPLRALSQYGSINKWLALDGFGFHEGYFGWRKSVLAQRRPSSMHGIAGKIFDQGLGRSLWFVLGANPNRIATVVEAFDRERQGDLWSGVALAATYAGGVAGSDLEELLARSSSHSNAFAQGVVFASEARRRAGNPVPHAELACRKVLRLPLTLAADLAVRCIPVGDDIESYQAWRLRIQEECSIVLLRRQRVAKEHS